MGLRNVSVWTHTSLGVSPVDTFAFLGMDPMAMLLDLEAKERCSD
jgi:hypothetical protein